MSRLQTAVSHVKAPRLEGANRVLEGTTQSAHRGLIFKEGAVSWVSDMIALAETDASWAGEDDLGKGNVEPLRSQRA
eukprot:9466988-Pyramimonas_sp.AAC.1